MIQLQYYMREEINEKIHSFSVSDFIIQQSRLLSVCRTDIN